MKSLIVESGEKELDDDKQLFYNDKWRYLVSLLSIIFFLVVFDCQLFLASAYLEREMYHEFCLTISITITSSMVTGGLSTYWLLQNISVKQFPFGPKRCLCLLTRFLFSGLVRDADVWSRWMVGKTHTHADPDTFQQAFLEVRSLRLYDALIGCATQSLLQTYFYMTKILHIDLYLKFLFSMTVISSSAVTAWSLITFAMTVNMQRVASSSKSETSNENNNVNSGLVSILLVTLGSKTSIVVFLFSSVIFVVNFLFFHLTSSHSVMN